jgi:hypothetical protein
MGAETEGHPEAKLIHPEILRSLERAKFQGFRRAIVRRAFPVELRTEGGLILGQRFAHMVDAVRVGRVVAKIVRGLHYLDTKSIMPRSHRISFVVPEHLEGIPPEARLLAIQQVNSFQGRQFKAGGPGQVFRYCRSLDYQAAGIESVWLLVFFRRYSFLARVIPLNAAA